MQWRTALLTHSLPRKRQHSAQCCKLLVTKRVQTPAAACCPQVLGGVHCCPAARPCMHARHTGPTQHCEPVDGPPPTRTTGCMRAAAAVCSHRQERTPPCRACCAGKATSRPQLLRPEPSRCYGDACKPAVSHNNPKHLLACAELTHPLCSKEDPCYQHCQHPEYMSPPDDPTRPPGSGAAAAAAAADCAPAACGPLDPFSIRGS
jgi:hypothetical protein